MPRQVHDRLALTYSLWSLGFVAVLAGFAWKFGWLPIELSKPETGRLALSDTGAPTATKPPETALVEQPSEAQFEPPIDSGIDREPLGSPDEPPQNPPARGVAKPSGRRPLPFEAATFPPRSVRPGRTPSDVAAISGQMPADLESPEPFARTPLRRTSAIPLSNDERPAQTLIRPDRRSTPVEPEPYAARSRVQPVSGEGNEDAELETPRDSGVVTAGGEFDAGSATNAPSSADPRLKEIEELLASGERLAAHKEMSKLYWKDADLRPALQERIDASAKIIYFSPQPHFMDPYVVQPSDQLSKIARLYQVPWEYLVRLNQADPRRIRPGQRLKVIKGPFAAMVDLSDFELIVHAHGYYVKRYRIGIGKDDSTPIGKFTVKTKLKNPTYYGPNGNVIDADDPANPLGERWIDLGDSYGIHGTIDPDSIGKAESKGCLRLNSADIEELYDLLSENSEVIIRK